MSLAAVRYSAIMSSQHRQATMRRVFDADDNALFVIDQSREDAVPQERWPIRGVKQVHIPNRTVKACMANFSHITRLCFARTRLDRRGASFVASPGRGFRAELSLRCLGRIPDCSFFGTPDDQGPTQQHSLPTPRPAISAVSKYECRKLEGVFCSDLCPRWSLDLNPRKRATPT